MKRLFLVGGSGDIGAAVKVRFVSSGWEVVAPIHSELDLEDIASIKKYFEEVLKNLDCNAIIFCAGWNEPMIFEETNTQVLEKSLQINTIGFYEILKYLLPNLKKKKDGSIVAVSSLYSVFSRKGRLAYAVSKHALNGLIKTLAIEIASYNIKVNSISPGFIDTKMTRKNNSKEKINELIEMIPMNRLGRTDEIANLTLYLCSEASSYLTGQNIIIDGGFSCGGFQR